MKTQPTPPPEVLGSPSGSALDGPDYEICAGQHKETGKWHGLLYRNCPTPSGCDRWLLKIEDNRGWPDAETAKAELRKSLEPNTYSANT